MSQLDYDVLFSVDLPKPSISLTPAGEVTWGQDISITCSISAEMLGGTFILEKTSGSFRKTQTSSSRSSTFNIHQVNFDNEGLYQCQYEKNISTFTFSSPKSDSVRLLVTGKKKKLFPKPDVLFTCRQSKGNKLVIKNKYSSAQRQHI